jgi:hypothetical protein
MVLLGAGRVVVLGSSVLEVEIAEERLVVIGTDRARG